MPILYPELQACIVTCRVVQKDGYTPAPFARISICTIVHFLWWNIPLFKTSAIANVYGKASFTLDKNTRYEFRIAWTGADARTRFWKEPLKTKICPWTMTATAPW